MLRGILVFIVLVGGAPMLRAQASPTASRMGDLKIGVGFTNADTDYVPNRVNGGTAYIDFDFKQHFGVEGEFRFVKDSSTNIYEKSYEIGGRYLRTYGKLVPYGKLMYGRGVFNFTNNGVTTANLAYNMAAVGAGVDYKALPYLYVRGDFEYQRWFGFRDTNVFPSKTSSLSPNLITIGVAYHFR